MNKDILSVVFISVILLSLFNSCSDGSNTLTPFEETKYRTIAYNSLSDQEKATIISDWKYAPVKKGIYHLENENIHQLIFSSDDKLIFILNKEDLTLAENQKLVAVTFNTYADALLGPLIIIIDTRSNEVIGGVVRF